jgi:hypothetical protein
MRRGLATAAAVLALGVGVTAAEATIGKGKFAGKTSAKDPLGFSVDKKGRVYSFYFQGVTLNCTDGDSFDTPSPEHPDSDGSTRVQTARNIRFVLDSKNRFRVSAANDTSGNGYSIRGRLKRDGSGASGVLHVFANFTDGGPGNPDTPDPNGSIHCDSGKIRWVAARNGPGQ